MSYNEKLAKVRALIEEHNTSLGTVQVTDPNRIDVSSFEKKLNQLGGTSEAALSRCSWEDLMECGLPKLLAREAAEIFRKQGPQVLMKGEKQVLSVKRVDSMTFDQLVAHYDPAEENAVSRKLKEISKDQAFIVLVKGVVNAPQTVTLLRELKAGYPPRELIVIDGKPIKVFKVGERESELVDENPLYPGRALRPDGTCDQINRSWEGVVLGTRVLLRLALTNSKEINNGNMNVQLAHDLLDVALEPDGLQTIERRFPKAVMAYSELANAGNLPSLRINIKKATSSGGRKEEPFA